MSFHECPHISKDGNNDCTCTLPQGECSHYDIHAIYRVKNGNHRGELVKVSGDILQLGIQSQGFWFRHCEISPIVPSNWQFYSKALIDLEKQELNDVEAYLCLK